MEIKKFISRREAAEYVSQQGLILSFSTLQKMACVGGGPKYAIFGKRAVYTRDDLDDWVVTRRRICSYWLNSRAQIAFSLWNREKW